jgi:hypothetical protein
MTMNELAKLVTKDEGLKKPLSIAQVKEVLKIISLRIATDEEVEKCLVKNGQRLVNQNLAKYGNMTGGRSGG